MTTMSTLHEIGLLYAKKQPGMIDAITEDAPIFGACKWRPATHGLWNVAERVTDIQGASFVGPDEPLPFVHTSRDLVHTDLSVLGGHMEVTTQKAKKFGGPQKYFNDQMSLILRHAGMTAEKRIVKFNWLKAAFESGNIRDASGGKSATGWFLLAVRFDEAANVGLYDEGQFDQGAILKVTFPYDGAEHLLAAEGHLGKYGYSIKYEGNFGWQILDAKRTVSAIFNVDETHKPTPAMVEDMLSDVRAQPGSTYIFCGPRAKTYGLNPYKTDNVQLANNDTDAKTRVETWNGISIITSYNFTSKIDPTSEGMADVAD